MTNIPRLAVVVTVINLVLLVFVLTQHRSAIAQAMHRFFGVVVLSW